MIINGDFNCRSAQWWEFDAENYEGQLLESIAAETGLHQMISEPTHLISLFPHDLAL